MGGQKDEDIINIIRTEYISDPKMSYRKLAEKYKFPLKKISQMGKKENWKQLRVQLGDKILKKTINKISTEKSEDLIRTIRTTNKLLTHVDKALEDDRQFNRHIVYENFKANEKVFDKSDARAIKDMSSALKNIATILQIEPKKENEDNNVSIEFTSEQEEYKA